MLWKRAKRRQRTWAPSATPGLEDQSSTQLLVLKRRNHSEDATLHKQYTPGSLAPSRRSSHSLGADRAPTDSALHICHFLVREASFAGIGMPRPQAAGPYAGALPNLRVVSQS